jgi:pyruvate/2-oxoglutarate dehydrogenase complex dihydrolipoamide dehydrogenase (E3) component
MSGANDCRLLESVRPPGHRNPEPARRYNLLVVGAGTAGLVTAAGAAGLGARVALVERDRMGGDCLNVGCVPSKTMLRSARALADARRAVAFGVRVPGGLSGDFAAVAERVHRLRADLAPNDSVERFRALGVDVFLGEARFTSGETVDVGGDTLRFTKAVIATGARAAAPPIPGLAEVGYLTNETVFESTELPGRLAIIGAGPIGCELSQAFARLGAEVVVIEMLPRILAREDEDAAAVVRRALEGDGVRFALDATVERVERRGGAKVVRFTAGGRDDEIVVDEILIGAGRAPNVEGIGLEAAGVAFDAKRGVVVDDRLATTNPRIFAAGDVCLDTKFTHMADFAARTVIQNALFLGGKRFSSWTVPWCTYTDPEVAHVGLYEKDAQAKGIAVTTLLRPLAEVDRARIDGDDEGFVKVHLRKGSDAILGATVVARHAGDLVSEITVAMAAGMGLGRLASVIHPYPTEAEAIRQLGDVYNRTRLTPTVKKLLELWFRWNR